MIINNMKIYITLITIIVSCFCLSFAEDKKENKSENIHGDDAKNEKAMLEMLGYMTVYRDGLKELGFGQEEAEDIARGLKRALSEESMDPSIQERMGEFQQFIEKRIKETQTMREQNQVARLDENISKGKEFIESLSLDKSVKSTPSGLHYKILKKGKSKYPKDYDSVRVHYKGTRIDGTVFDSSYARGEPADFSLQGVVPGFAEGLTKVGEGGQIILFIPSD